MLHRKDCLWQVLLACFLQDKMCSQNVLFTLFLHYFIDIFQAFFMPKTSCFKNSREIEINFIKFILNYIHKKKKKITIGFINSRNKENNILSRWKTNIFIKIRLCLNFTISQIFCENINKKLNFSAI